MKKYLYLLIVIMLGINMSACGKAAAGTDVPASTAAPADSGAATVTPANPVDLGSPVEDGFLFAPMEGEYDVPQVDVRDFISALRKEAVVNGDLEVVSAVPAGTTWETVLAHYDAEAKANGWALEGTRDVTVTKGYLCTVALFTHDTSKILLAYYPLGDKLVIVQIKGQ